MTFEEYQRHSRKTAIYPGAGNGKLPIYPVLGLCGEAGEVADKLKKIIRDKGGKMDADERELLKKELGDVLWYLAQLSTDLGFSLDDVAWVNLEKLMSRMERGHLHGSGDNR